MKKAEMGIGTLILFIAMILVAAVAAGVLLSTAVGLQNKALLTGKRTKDSVATQLEVSLIYGEDGSDSNVEKFYTQMQLAPGSMPIKYSEMSIIMSTYNDSSEMEFNSTADCDTNFPPVGQFAVQELLSDGNANYLSRGEVVKFCFQYKRSVGEDEEVVMQFIPNTGNPVIMNFVTPSIMNQQRIVLFP